MFHEIAQDILIDLYSDKERKIKTFKDYLVLAVDGSDIKVPTTKENYETFGICYNQKTKNTNNSPAMASISCISDCLNDFVLDTQIDKFKYSERKSGLKNIENIRNILSDRKRLIIFDRGYFSYEFLYRIKHEKFIFRITDAQFKNEKKAMEDELTFNIDNKIKNKFYEIEDRKDIITYLLDENVKYKLLKFKLSTGKYEYLLTNVFDENIKFEDFFYLYGLRWNIENSYRDLKGKLKLEHFSGYKPDIIRQDIYVSVILHNNISAHIAELDDIQEEKEFKYPVKVNRNYATGILKTLTIMLFLEEDENKRKRHYEIYSEKLKNTVIAIVDGRKFERQKRHPKNKCKMSYKTSY